MSSGDWVCGQGSEQAWQCSSGSDPAVLPEPKPQENSPVVAATQASHPATLSVTQATISDTPSPEPLNHSKLPAKGYVIQLLAIRDQSQAPSYVTSYPVEKATVATIEDDQGQAWHVLLLGPFDAHVDAAESLHLLELPDEAPLPWIRTNRSINEQLVAPLKTITP